MIPQGSLVAMLSAMLCIITTTAYLATATPLNGQISIDGYANEFMGQTLNGKSAFGKPGLSIYKPLGSSDKTGINLAIGEHNRRMAFIKCVDRRETEKDSSNLEAVQREKMAFGMLYSALKTLNGEQASGRRYVSEPYTFFDYKKDTCFVYSYDGEINLLEYIDRIKDIKEKIRVLKIVIYQIINGSAYIVNAGLVHNDIKPENIMISFPNPKNRQEPKATLVDFDIAMPLKNSNGRFDPSDFYSGTLPYLAPEVVVEDIKDPTKKDSWSIAATLRFLLTGTHLINAQYDFETGLRGIYRKGVSRAAYTNLFIRNRELSPSDRQLADSLAEPLTNIIKDLLVANPALRPSPPQYWDKIKPSVSYISQAKSAVSGWFGNPSK
ncbi:kinase-like domain-containing protein [Syncephalis fuscata]|nr:kinase-like domain-containing protein [Syncephalis fuscata]